VKKLQSTALRRNFGLAFERLEVWSFNPWRRYSLFLILFLSSFFIGSSLGAINGVLALMDPVGAFISVFILELMIRFRRNLLLSDKHMFGLNLLDMIRIGLTYGLLLEGFKLL